MLGLPTASESPQSGRSPTGNSSTQGANNGRFAVGPNADNPIWSRSLTERGLPLLRPFLMNLFLGTY